MDTDSRLTELEIKLSFAEDLIEALNQTVISQQRQIELLQAEMRALERQLQAALPAEDRNPGDEVPPHY
jgi:SlyX protein